MWPEKPFLIRVIIGLALVTGGGIGEAVIVADYDTAESPPYGDWDLDWSYVYRYKLSSAVAVAPNWLLTAAHVADDNFPSNVVVNGVTNIQQEIIFHSGEFDPDRTNKADLALVRFDKEFPGYYPLYTNTFPTAPPQKLQAVLVGFGNTGAVYSTYYNDSGDGAGTKRWGTQRIDGPDTVNYNAWGLTGMTYNEGIQMMFNLTDTSYEAGLGVRDSGGGTFVKEDGTWKLAAINTARYGSSPDWTGVFAVSLPAYHSWITNVISPDADYDGDGIPNYWEQQYSTSITGLVASADDDGDGFTNLQEYIADTNPTNASSFLYAAGSFVDPDHVFTFVGSTARIYQVYHTTNTLTHTNLVWTPAHTNTIPGEGPDTAIVITNGIYSPVYYRLRVTLP